MNDEQYHGWIWWIWWMNECSRARKWEKERMKTREYFGIRSPYQLLIIKHSYLFKQLAVVKLSDFFHFSSLPYPSIIFPFSTWATTNTYLIAIWMKNAFQSHNKQYIHVQFSVDYYYYICILVRNIMAIIIIKWKWTWTEHQIIIKSANVFVPNWPVYTVYSNRSINI